MKKEWIKPEVSILGMENTNEECSTFDEKGEKIHMCNWCFEVFWTHDGEIAHEATCAKRPTHPDLGEGEDIYPTPATS